MQNISQILKRFPGQAIGIAIVLVTLFTSSSSVSAIVKSATSKNLSIPEVLSAEVKHDEDVDSQNKEDEDHGLISKVKKALSTPTSHPVANLIAAIASPTPGTGTNNANLCIITVFGQEYDVTNLQTTHSGGNVFNCGADNTSLYQSAHGTNVSRIAKYLYTGTPVGTPTGTNGSSEHDDNDDDGHEEEYNNSFDEAWEKAKHIEDNDYDD